MPNKNLIQLGSYRELLSHWEAVRERIIAGRITGIHTTILEDEEERVIAAGIYRNNPQRAISAILDASAARMLTQDEPPLFQSSNI